jgi:hypothetical protein
MLEWGDPKERRGEHWDQFAANGLADTATYDATAAQVSLRIALCFTFHQAGMCRSLVSFFYAGRHTQPVVQIYGTSSDVLSRTLTAEQIA